MSWLADGSANRINKCYMRNFLDLSGNLKVRSTKNVIAVNVNWTQIGGDLDGAESGDYFGQAVAISSDGSIIAVGAPYADGGNKNRNGIVYVYQYDGSSWNQLGSDINGELAADYSGDDRQLAISNDGTRIAIGSRYNTASRGHVRVWDYNGTSWSLNAELNHSTNTQYFSRRLAMSGDGNTIAGGYMDSSRKGAVKVYHYNGSSWGTRGGDIFGKMNNHYAGYTGDIAINDDGTILAISSVVDNGYVRMYQWNGSSYNQIGEILSDNIGHSLDLNSDGTIVAIGNPFLDAPSQGNVGATWVYQYDGSTWNQLGSDIGYQSSNQDQVGASVSLSSDGTFLAMSGPFNDDAGTDRGKVMIFNYLGGSWVQVGENIYGEANNDQYGGKGPLAISADGSRVVIGAYRNDGGGADSGHVRVYDGGFSNGNITSASKVPITALDVSGGTVSILNNTMDVSYGIVDISGAAWIKRGLSGATISNNYKCGLIIESTKTSSNQVVLQIETAGQTDTFSVRGDGAMYGANALKFSSDDRIKINEQHITNAIETINKLSPQIYTKLNKFEEDGGIPIGTESGLIAQEIYYKAPELRHLVHVQGKSVEGNRVQVQDMCGNDIDTSGNNIQNDPDYNALGWGKKSAYVDYIGLIPYLIKCNQEQSALITGRQSMIDKQTELINNFKDRLLILENK